MAWQSMLGAPPAKTLDTNGFCLFCLRKVEGQSSSTRPGPNSRKTDKGRKVFRTPKQEETIRRFSKLIGRYLKSDFIRDEKDGGEGMVDSSAKEGDLLNESFEKEKFMDFGLACTDCYSVLEKVCQIYTELEGMKLELQWHVGKLKDIVASSKNAPTRVRAFQNEMSGKDDGIKMKEIETFRKDFLKKCTLKFQNIRPRVHLKRKMADSMDKSNKRRVPGHIVPEAEAPKNKIQIVSAADDDDDSHPIIDISIVKQEPGLVPTSSFEINSESEDPSTETEIPVVDSNNCVDVDEASFDAFHTQGEDDMDIDYEYSTNDKKILAPQIQQIKSMATPATDHESEIACNLEKLSRLVRSFRNDGRGCRSNLEEGKQNNSEAVKSASQESVPLTLPSTNGQKRGLLQLQPPAQDQDTNNDDSSEAHSPMGTSESNSDSEDQLSKVNGNTIVNGQDSPPSATKGGEDPADEGQHKPSILLTMLTPPKKPVDEIDLEASPLVPSPEPVEIKQAEAICSICNQKFSSAALLAPHMYTHTDPKSWPFHCKYCNQRFYKVSDFKRHRISVMHIQNKKVHKMNKNKPIRGRGRPSTSVFKKPYEFKPKPSTSTSEVVYLDQSPPSTSASGLEEKKNVKVVRIIYRAKEKPFAANQNSTSNGTPTKTKNNNSSNAEDAEVVTID